MHYQTCLEFVALMAFSMDCGNVESERSVTGHVSKPDLPLSLCVNLISAPALYLTCIERRLMPVDRS